MKTKDMIAEFLEKQLNRVNSVNNEKVIGVKLRNATLFSSVIYIETEKAEYKVEIVNRNDEEKCMETGKIFNWQLLDSEE